MNITAVLLAATLALACTAAHAADEAAAPPPKPLDLRAPDVTKLYTQRQLDRLIAKMEADFIERIEVEGARIPAPEFTPRVWPGIAAPLLGTVQSDAGVAHLRADSSGPGAAVSAISGFTTEGFISNPSAFRRVTPSSSNRPGACRRCARIRAFDGNTFPHR